MSPVRHTCVLSSVWVLLFLGPWCCRRAALLLGGLFLFLFCAPLCVPVFLFALLDCFFSRVCVCLSLLLLVVEYLLLNKGCFVDEDHDVLFFRSRTNRKSMDQFNVPHVHVTYDCRRGRRRGCPRPRGADGSGADGAVLRQDGHGGGRHRKEEGRGDPAGQGGQAGRWNPLILFCENPTPSSAALLPAACAVCAEDRKRAV